ncbi:heme-binding domain-containing protein [Gilvibacter sediminis]|uniref:heme-binding domain-containing protein n=1 Tax=Gilvibacter sediminis TaxID=379071 RepID=UPI002350DB67|nr:heme-binding domain-containing protein [Gilvibacter sediminis]MDC7999066.1 heme-binding domain-containing protein [Gilvibacter sediminis]
MKILKKVLTLALVAFVVMQFFRVEKNEAQGDYLEAFVAETNPPTEVMETLKTACLDCHSNNTRYPWYAEIAPISFWLDDHIRHGKGELNFSEWGSYAKGRKDHKMQEIIEQVENRWMPMTSYTKVHKDAILTEEQITSIVSWAGQYRALINLGDRPQ